jgi:hypothetical protein
MYTLTAIVPSIGTVEYEAVFYPIDNSEEVDVDISKITINKAPVIKFPFLEKLLLKNARAQWQSKYKNWYYGELNDMYKLMYEDWSPK